MVVAKPKFLSRQSPKNFEPAGDRDFEPYIFRKKIMATRLITTSDGRLATTWATGD